MGVCVGVGLFSVVNCGCVCCVFGLKLQGVGEGVGCRKGEVLVGMGGLCVGEGAYGRGCRRGMWEG